jgi:hypothetical protein
MLQKDSPDFDVIPVSRRVQRRAAICGSGIDIRPLRQQKPDHFRPAKSSVDCSLLTN